MIDYTHDYKYLGYFNEFLDADESIQKVYTCANRALGVLIAKAKAVHGFPLSVFSHLFDACVIPLGTYLGSREKTASGENPKQCTEILF